MENQLRGTALQSLHKGLGTRGEGVRGLAFMKISPKKKNHYLGVYE